MMAYEDFLQAFAKEQGLVDANEMRSKFAQKYAYAIGARDATQTVLTRLEGVLPQDLSQVRALHIGCSYGSLLIELARRGATCVGVDTSEPKLELARVNAEGDAEVTFLKSYVAVRSHVGLLREHGPFSLIIVSDAFERTYDTVKLVSHLRSLAAEGAILTYRIFNPFSTSAVLSDPVKKKLGTTLLPPDKIFDYTGTNYTMFFRPLEHYEAILAHFGFKPVQSLVEPPGSNEEQMRAIIGKDLVRIRKALTSDAAAASKAFAAVRTACREYIEETRADLATLDLQALYAKYRATHWEGIQGCDVRFA